MAKGKYRRVSELYVTGTELVLEDGTIFWLQVLNPYERQEAQTDAQTARSRLVLALKDEDSDETARIRGTFEALPDEEVVDILVEYEAGEAMVKSVNAIKDDPDWAERNAILERSDDLIARPATDPERALLTKVNGEYVREIQDRMGEELDFHRERFSQMDRGELWEVYVEKIIEAQGSERAIAEFQLTEMWLATRECEGTFDSINERYTHEGCDGHRQRVYESKTEVRALPEALQNLMRAKLDELQMTVREAKNLDRQRSSFGSFPLPSVEAASTPSTPSETPDSAPGNSPLQSTTA